MRIRLRIPAREAPCMRMPVQEYLRMRINNDNYYQMEAAFLQNLYTMIILKILVNISVNLHLSTLPSSNQELESINTESQLVRFATLIVQLIKILLDSRYSLTLFL